MKGWRIAAAAGILALSVSGASLAAPGAKPAGGTDAALRASQMKKQATQQFEAGMTQLKMTEEQKKRARKPFDSTMSEMTKINDSGGTPQQKQQKAAPVLQTLRTGMEKILTPEQLKQAKAMEAERMKRFQGGAAAPPPPPPPPPPGR